ncbi:nuclease [Mycobacteroides abscessus]|nr:nuclease [Mycobacteroides abscessus]
MTLTPDPPGSVDQFTLLRLQVINWGVFDGYHSVIFAPRGTLIAGRSGSGKSTLLDAISLGFLPSKRRNFNASSDIGQRTVDKYIRGQWGEQRAGTDDPKLMYLRGDGAAWSAVSLTYSSGAGKNVTGLVLKRLAADKISDPVSDYFLIDSAADIKDVCNTWVEKGFASAVLRDAGWRGGGKGNNETWYLSQLYAAIGIRASEAAQQLLGKAKSLKSVGGLERFVREYMLDEPESIKDIAGALAQIDPLVAARKDLEVAQQKHHTLDGIEDAYETFAAESARLDSVTTIDRPMISDFVDHLRKDKCGPEVERLDRELREAGDALDVLDGRKDTALKRLKLLISQEAEIGGGLISVEHALQAARTHAEGVSRNARSYEQLIFEVGYPPADNETDFAELRQLCWERSEQITAELKASSGKYHAAIQKERNAHDRVVFAEAELARVQANGSPIPPSESEMRARIVAAIGVSAKQLPYVAELMEIGHGKQRWQVAAEKALRSAGLNLLVPQRYFRDVLSFAHANNMRGYLNLHEVVPGVGAAEPRRDTLASMLQLADPSHECAASALAVISNAGDFVCVDAPAEFDQFNRAITDSGLMKIGAGRARKDDRRPPKASEYIFQGDIESKLDALAADVAEAQADQELARAEANDIEADREQQRAQHATALAVYKNFAAFSEIDTATADREVAQLDEQYQEMLKENPDLEKLQQQVEQQQKSYDDIMKEIALLRQTEEKTDNYRTALLDLSDVLQPAAVSDRVRRELEQYAASVFSVLDLLHPKQFRDELAQKVESEQTSLRESLRRSRQRVERIIGQFDERFRESIPNDSDDIDAKAADYVELWQRIENRDLPAAYDRMLKHITRDAPTALLNLRTKADNAAALIQAQIERVNTGLSSVEFNTGTRLKLRAPERNLAAVRELNERCTRISQRAAAVAAGDKDAIPAQYTEILELRTLLGSNEPEHRQWTRDALDVRHRFTMYCDELDANDPDTVIRSHSNSEDNSGGEQEKLMAFCLAGALSYNLADPESGDNRPVFAQLMLDEAFSKSDPVFARQALSAFGRFGFQLVIVATLQNSTVIEPHVGGVVLVSKPDRPGVRPVAAVQAQSIEEFVPFRRGLARQPNKASDHL